MVILIINRMCLQITYSNCEAEIQLSIGFDIVSDLFGLEEILSVAYTQRSYWQIYVESTPFRETNYNPEFMITLPLNKKYKNVSLTVLTLSFAHQSNGKGNITKQNLVNDTSSSAIVEEHPEWFENNSRSWNYLRASAIFQYKSLFVELSGVVRSSEDEETDDNPDLLDYLGYGSLNLYYPRGRSFTELHLRHNFKHSRGAAELNWSYPFFNRESTYWYIKAFSGYGESLIDYNNNISKVALGLSFSR